MLPHSVSVGFIQLRLPPILPSSCQCGYIDMCASTHLSISHPPLIHLAVHPHIHPSSIHPFTHPSTAYLPINSPPHTHIYASQPLIHLLPTSPPTPPSLVHLPIHPFIHLSIHPPIHHPLTYPSLHLLSVFVDPIACSGFSDLFCDGHRSYRGEIPSSGGSGGT